jgi:hypothetical protein
MRYLKIYEKFDDIHKICKKYGIKNYTINEDGSIDVNDDVDLRNEGLTKIPLMFGNISGSFNCGYNQLTSLGGCPVSVGGVFSCSENQLASLEGCPTSVGGSFYCSSNQLTSLEGCPKSIRGSITLRDNPVYEIWNLFMDKDKIELFNDYDIIRGEDIIISRLNYFLKEIGKESIVKGYNNI